MTSYTYVTNLSSQNVYVSWSDGPVNRLISSGSHDSDQYSNSTHSDETITVFVSDASKFTTVTVGGDRSAVLVNGRAPGVIEIWRVTYGTLTEKEAWLGVVYY